MKHLKNYKLFEAGEWSGTRSLNDIKNINEIDDNDEGAQMILSMKDTLEDLKELINKDIDFKIKNIIGFDQYQGPYGLVKINNKIYNIWQEGELKFWIENYRIDNTSKKGMKAGFEGDIYDISDIINETEPLYTVKGQLDIIENHPQDIHKIIDKILPEVKKKHPHFKTGADLNLI